MRILILSAMYPNPADPAFGIFVHRHAQALRQAGADALVMAPLVWTPPFLKWRGGDLSRVPVEDRWEDVPVYRPRRLGFGKNLLRWAYPYYPIFYSRAIRPHVEKLWQEKPFDIIESHAAIVDGRVGAMLSEKYALPNILYIHGHSLIETPKMGPAVVGSVQESLEMADRIVLSGPWMKKLAARKPWNCPDQKMITLPYGVRLELKVEKPDPTLSKKYSNKKVIVASGFLIKRKCQDILIEALSEVTKRFPDTLLILIGHGPQKSALEQKVHQLGLEHHVEFTGNLQQQDVFRYFSVAKVMALPSYDEAFGIVYLEAWAHDCPVIACEGEGIAHLVKEHETGLLVPKKAPEATAKALIQLLDNPEQAETMGQRGRKLVEKEYTWERNAQQSLDLYQQILDERKFSPLKET
jgi:glycosyltransferase involved in cell wall biosynthesis